MCVRDIIFIIWILTDRRLLRLCRQSPSQKLSQSFHLLVRNSLCSVAPKYTVSVILGEIEIDAPYLEMITI